MTIVLDTLKRVTDGLEFLNETQASDTQTYRHYKALVKEAREQIDAMAVEELEHAHGNTAALRKALVSARTYLQRVDHLPNDAMRRLFEIAWADVNAALAAPARNCDVEYADQVEMYGAFKDWCKAMGHTMEPMLAYDAFEWLLATAKGEVHEKGDPK